MLSTKTTAAITAAAPLLLGAGLLYWQTMSKQHTEKEDNCTTNKEKISSTKSMTTPTGKTGREVKQEEKERVSPEAEETFCCGPCNPSSLDLSLLPCIRQRRSVFPNE